MARRERAYPGIWSGAPSGLSEGAGDFFLKYLDVQRKGINRFTC